MKKLISISTILLSLSFNSYGYGCSHQLIVVSSIVPDSQGIYWLNYGDTLIIKFTLKTYDENCSDCHSGHWPNLFDNNQMAITPITTGDDSTSTYALIDTGTYKLQLIVAASSCFFSTYNSYIKIQYISTYISDLTNNNQIKIYQSTLSGLFQVTTERRLKKIQIMDAEGRIIFVAVNNPSEIDLTNFSNGIYFYAIEDDKEKVFRSRILKN